TRGSVASNRRRQQSNRGSSNENEHVQCAEVVVHGGARCNARRVRVHAVRLFLVVWIESERRGWRSRGGTGQRQSAGRGQGTRRGSQARRARAVLRRE